MCVCFPLALTLCYSARPSNWNSLMSAQSNLESDDGQNPELGEVNELMDVAAVAAFLRNQGIPDEYCKTFEGTNNIIKR